MHVPKTVVAYDNLELEHGAIVEKNLDANYTDVDSLREIHKTPTARTYADGQMSGPLPSA